MNNFEIRKSIYDDIRKNCNLITDNGIQLEIDLNWQQTSMLQLSVENYILEKKSQCLLFVYMMFNVTLILLFEDMVQGST